MKDFFYSLMTDKYNGWWAMPFKFALQLVSLVYGACIFIRALLYRAGIFKVSSVPLKVISVGNITLGGTGKTPFVIALSAILKDELKKEACVLIRGYGWDEQAMLKRRLADIPVMVGEDRAKSARRAIRLYGSNIAVLDDGFQHWELFRDLDIVLIDSRNPFGNGHLFPRGVLREGKNALSRAHVIVFTKASQATRGLEALKDKVSAINGRAVFLEANHEPTHFYNLRMNEQFPLEHVRGKRVMLLSSIGDPQYFADTVKSLGADIAEHITFPDHHDYRKRDVDDILVKCSERSFDYIVTTEKDAVKFSRMGFHFKGYKLLVLAVRMSIIKGKEELIVRLRGIYTD